MCIRDRGYWIPGPVGSFGIGEDNPGFREFLVVVAPDVEIPFRRTTRGAARGLKPGMLVGGVVDDQFGDDFKPCLLYTSRCV